MVQKYPRTQKIIPLGLKLAIFGIFVPFEGNFTPLCPLLGPLRVKIKKLSGWVFLRCKNIPARKKSTLSVENWWFLNFGPIWGILPHCAPPKKCDFPKFNFKTHFQMQKSNSHENFIKNGQKLPILEFGPIWGDFTPLCPPKMQFSQIWPQNSFPNTKI